MTTTQIKCDCETHRGPVMSSLRPMKVVRDHYDNPAVVTKVDAHWVTFVQLTGSDFGRSSSKPRADVERQIAERPVSAAQIEWAKVRWAEYKGSRL